MPCKQATKTPPLPQEIVDHILDQVVASGKGWRATLLVCCVVSRSFRPHSQKNIFSQIEFLVDECANKRAERLLKVITSGTKRHLLTSIHSVTLLLKIPAQKKILSRFQRLNNFYRKSHARLLQVAEKVRLWDNHLVRLLELFILLPLEKLALENRHETEFLSWTTLDDRQHKVNLPELLFRMVSNPALTSLSIEGIEKLPLSFLTRPSRLRELVLRHVNEPVADHTEPSHRLSSHLINIKDLTIANSSYTFFTLLCMPLPASSLMPPSPPYFPHLTTIVVSLPRMSVWTPCVLRFLLCASHSLEILELHDTYYLGNSFDLEQVDLDYLSHFSSLHTLKFIGKSYPVGRISSKLCHIAELLVSATSVIPIRSITINIYIDWPRSQYFSIQWDSILFGPTSRLAWTAMDLALTNPMFKDLSLVNIALKVVDYEEEEPSFVAFRPYLPRTRGRRSVKVEGVVATVPFFD